LWLPFVCFCFIFVIGVDLHIYALGGVKRKRVKLSPCIIK
jgi:hypothetical protein